MRLADFYILRAVKSVTSSIYGYLANNTRVYRSIPKEIDCFISDQKEMGGGINSCYEDYLDILDINKKGLDWYLSLFSDAKGKQIYGGAIQTEFLAHVLLLGKLQ